MIAELQGLVRDRLKASPAQIAEFCREHVTFAKV
jgi:hypothetical protein